METYETILSRVVLTILSITKKAPNCLSNVRLSTVLAEIELQFELAQSSTFQSVSQITLQNAHKSDLR